jgi:hypothetical protein
MRRAAFHTLLLLSGVAHAAEPSALPEHLRDTGLYADASMSQLQTGVLAFSPQYPLWSDGATKRRWIQLPAGASIDASAPDAWDFPRGTKLWKEFSFGGRVETRFIERGMDGAWRYASYLWSTDGKDAVRVPAAGIRELPVPSAPGARYSIPAQDDCRACHEGAPVPVLGFSALQLSPDRDREALHADADDAAHARADLRSLVASGLLKNLPAELSAHPPRIAAANATERAALGYLHANCGHCHNDDGPLAVLEMSLAQRVGAKESAGEVLRSIIAMPGQFRIAGGTVRVAPGHPGASVVALRMQSRDPLQQMPPLGTSEVDIEAMTLIGRWIESLPVQNP